MDYDPDELLDHVDEWKFKLHDKLAAMTPEERAAFWKSIEDDARARGMKVMSREEAESITAKYPRRATG